MTKHNIEKRAVVQHYARKGYTPAAIQQAVGCTMDFVLRWYGRDDVHRHPGSGRPLRLKPSTLDEIRRRLTRPKKPTSLRKVAVETGLSKSTISNAARKMGLKPYHKRVTPALSEAMKKRRVQFAKDWEHADWTKIVAIDEKSFSIGCVGNRKNDVVWATSPEDVPSIPRFKSYSTLHVCGGISMNGITSLHVFTEIMTAKLFVDILDHTIVHGGNELYPDEDWVLLMDNDPKHRSKLSSQYLEEHQVKYISKDEWPSNSPDLNPIENIWGYMQQQLNRDPPRTFDKLKEAVLREWDKLPFEVIKNTMSSMPGRLNKVIKSKGAAIDY